ncbi:hypothetical protein AN958_09336 [Leucoagaricus sp. SymC.cos]|nr:hypothetical protein AN958_09336 [Leucoagaricus sp. SymC.cos]
MVREGNANVGVKVRSPHEDEVPARFVNAEVLGVYFVFRAVCIYRVNQKLERLAKSLS